MWHVRYKALAINMCTQSARRFDHRHTVGIQLVHQVVDKLRSVAQVVHIERFVQSLCHCLYGAHINTAVGEEALI